MPLNVIIDQCYQPLNVITFQKNHLLIFNKYKFYNYYYHSVNVIIFLHKVITLSDFYYKLFNKVYKDNDIILIDKIDNMLNLELLVIKLFVATVITYFSLFI